MLRQRATDFQLVSCLLCLLSLILPNTPKLVKTVELSLDRNYVFGSHPHGIMSIGAFCNFCTGSNGFSQQFPGLRASLVVLAGLLYLPVSRDYLMAYGKLPAEWEEVPSSQGN